MADLLGEIASEEFEAAESAKPETGPAHLIGAIKHTAYKAYEAPGALAGTIGSLLGGSGLGKVSMEEGTNVFERAAIAHRNIVKKAIDKSPDVQDWLKAVKEEREPFLSEVLGQQGPTLAALAMTVPSAVAAGMALPGAAAVGTVALVSMLGKGVAGAMFLGMNREETYDVLRDAKVPHETALATSLVAGSLKTGLDMVGLESITRTFRGKALTNALTTLVSKNMAARVGAGLAGPALTEGVTEGTQGVVDYLAKEYTTGKQQGETIGQFSERMMTEKHWGELSEEFWKSAKFGAVSALGFGAAGVAASSVARKLAPEPAREGELDSRTPPPAALPPPEQPVVPAEWGKQAEQVMEMWYGKSKAYDLASPDGLNKAVIDLYDMRQEIGKKAEEEVARILSTDETFQEMQRQLGKTRYRVDLLQSFVDRAKEGNREVLQGTLTSLAKQNERLRYLEQRQNETFAAWHERIVKDMEEIMHLSERAKELEGAFNARQREDLAAQPNVEDENFIEKATKRLDYLEDKTTEGLPEGVRQMGAMEQRAVEKVRPGWTADERIQAAIAEREKDSEVDGIPVFNIPTEVKAELIATPGAYLGARFNKTTHDIMGIPASSTPKDVLLTQLRIMLLEGGREKYGSFDEMLSVAKRDAYEVAMRQGWGEAQAARIKNLSAKNLAKPREAFKKGYGDVRFGIKFEQHPGRYERAIERLPFNWKTYAMGRTQDQLEELIGAWKRNGLRDRVKYGRALQMEREGARESVFRSVKPGDFIMGTLRYDGPGIGGHAWTEMTSKRSFTTTTKNADDVYQTRRGFIAPSASFGLPLEGRGIDLRTSTQDEIRPLLDGKLKDHTVRVDRLTERGEEITVEENAQLVVNELDGKIDVYEAMLRCLNG